MAEKAPTLKSKLLWPGAVGASDALASVGLGRNLWISTGLAERKGKPGVFYWTDESAGLTQLVDEAPLVLAQMAAPVLVDGAIESVPIASALPPSSVNAGGFKPVYGLPMGLLALAAVGGGSSSAQSSAPPQAAVKTTFSKITAYADDNGAMSEKLSLADFLGTGVQGVTAENLAAIHTALASTSVLGSEVDTLAKVQALVDSFNQIMQEANGAALDATLADPTATDFLAVGAHLGKAASAPAALNLLNDSVGALPDAAAVTLDNINMLSAVVDKVFGAAAGSGPTPSVAELGVLGVSGVTASNLPAVVAGIVATPDDGSLVGSLLALQGVSDAAVNLPPVPISTAVIATLTDDSMGSVVVPSGGTTFDTTPLLAGSLSAVLALGEVLVVYRDAVRVGNAVVAGVGWSFMDADVPVGGHAYTVGVEGAAGRSGVMSAAYTVTLAQAPPANAAPMGMNSTVSVNGNHVLSLADFGFVDVDGDAMSGVRVNSGADLFLGGVALVMGSTVSAAQVVAGQLEWRAPNLNLGTTLAPINFNVLDNVGAGTLSEVPNTLTLSRFVNPAASAVDSGSRFAVELSATGSLGWQQAYDAAMAGGGHLATFEGGVGNATAIATAVAQYGVSDYSAWLGLEQSSNGSEPRTGWHWSSGGTDVAWAANQPDGSADWGVLWRGGGSTQLDDQPGPLAARMVEYENAKFVRTGDANFVDVLTGSARDDWMAGLGGADVIKTMQGHDRVMVPDMIFASVDGGSGFDVLEFTAAVNVQGAAFVNKVSGVEGIHLGMGNQSLVISALQVQALSGTTDTLYVSSSGSGDVLDLAEVIGTGANEWHNTGRAHGVATYQYFDATNTATLIRVLVDEAVVVG